MYKTDEPINEENVKNLRILSNEAEKAFSEQYLKIHPELVGLKIAQSIDKLTERVSELIDVLKSCK